jgi:hypothetical protein
MTITDIARQQIADLSARYAATPARTRAAYNESEIRHYFVLPLFRALGWNTENPAEFSAEEQISRGFVDFGFYLNQIPVFYLETKRVAQKLGTLDNVRQSINYSYLKGVTWAALTDFEQLMVFNADWEERDPLKARFLDLHYDQYAGEGFDDLWLLSKPAMSAQPRAIDLRAERYGAKAKKEPVTRTLFNDLTQWRRALFNDIRQMRATLWATDSRAVDNAVQKLFDRLIFIRTVEDRGVEPNQLNALVRQTERRGRDLYPGLLKLFRELDAVYNSNLFAQHALDTMEITDIGLLREIISGLYKAQGGLIQYDFNAITADVLGGVYEQYLGFKATDPDAQLDTLKSRKRKSQGIYYTPQYVVRYIVANTLGRLLAEGAHPDNLRVLDPACGSGSFLIEAFDVLDRAYAGRHPDATPAERSAWRRRILTHNLYGVDLDDQAVEVTRLNLMLRAALERGKLPLLTNIRHGNSLIDDDAVAGAGLGFVWGERFAEVMEAGGFDVVIGNPPYVPIESMSELEREYYTSTYDVLERKYDSSIIFLLAMLTNLRKPNGRLGYISSISWQTGENFAKVRQHLIQSYGVERLVNLPFDVFKDAYVDTGIFILSANKQEHYEIFNFPKKTPVTDLNGLSYSSVALNQIQPPAFKMILNPLSSSIMSRFQESEGKFITLGDITESRQGLAGSNFSIVTSSDDYTYPFLSQGQVYRYELSVEKLRLVDLRPYLSLARFYDAVPKILIRRLINRDDRLMATFTDEKLLFTKDINPFVMKEDQWSPYYLLGIINSKLISYLYTNSSTLATKDDFRQTTLAELRRLPIRAINFDDPAERAQHDRLVALVETMLALKRDHAAATDALSERRHELAGDIARTDRQIDALVYQLYGLTDDDIALIEASGG